MTRYIESFHFIRPEAFVLVPVVVVIWWFWHRSVDPLKGWREQIDATLLKELVVGKHSKKSGPFLWILVAWLLACLGIAGPTWRLEPSPFADDATPLMVLLKADISMDAPDPMPSRLARAQIKIADLAIVRKGQPLGLIAYAGSSHLVLPPTRDTEVVADMASEISPEIIPVSGDRLDFALKDADRIFRENGQNGSVVVFADSVETDLELLSELDLSMSVQFLSINSPDSSQNRSLNLAADELGADVSQLDYQDEDIQTIVRRASKTPVAKKGEEGGQWQESGYWVLPALALFFILSFRRETKEGEVQAG